MRLTAIILLIAGTAGAGELVGPPAPERYAPPETAWHQTRTDVAWMTGAAVLDLGTTEFALSQCETCREGNPLGGSQIARVGLKLGLTAGISAVCHHLHKQGRHREAKMARWLTVGMWVGVSVVNLTHSR